MARIQTMPLPGEQFAFVIDEVGDRVSQFTPDDLGRLKAMTGAVAVLVYPDTLDVA